MSSHETFGGQPERHEAQTRTYAVAARFENQFDAGRTYRSVQESIFDAKSDLSVYRLQLNAEWHVAAIGEQPPSDVAAAIQEQLAQGELTRLPDVVLGALLQRRVHATRLGPWVEGHYENAGDPPSR